MSLIIHPDRAGDGRTKKFQLLQSAYTTVLEFLERRDIMENGDGGRRCEEAKKYPNIPDKKDNLKISDTKKSSMSELINVTIYMTQNFYLPTITQEDRVMDWLLRVERMTCPVRW